MELQPSERLCGFGRPKNRFGGNLVRILFITSTRIGDAILSSGLLAHLTVANPEARITVVCGPPAAPLFDFTPQVEQVIVLKKKKYSLHWLELWGQTSLRFWDIIVDLRSSAISWLVPTGKRYVLPPGQSPDHRVVRLAKLLNIDALPAPHIWPGEEARREAGRLLAGDGKWIAVGPTANWIGKQWPAERFAEVALRLRSEDGPLNGAGLVVLGGEGERDMAMPVIQNGGAQNTIDLVGKVDLLTAYAALEKCSLFLGNDSGLMHLSAAAGTPTLGVFGPSRDTHYAPWGQYCGVVRAQSYEEIVASPEFDHLKSVSYMMPLGVDDVEAAAIDLISKAQAR
jgi:ADP-heptose:LPS heptosyltransferase